MLLDEVRGLNDQILKLVGQNASLEEQKKIDIEKIRDLQTDLAKATNQISTSEAQRDKAEQARHSAMTQIWYIMFGCAFILLSGAFFFYRHTS